MHINICQYTFGNRNSTRGENNVYRNREMSATGKTANNLFPVFLPNPGEFFGKKQITSIVFLAALSLHEFFQLPRTAIIHGIDNPGEQVRIGSILPGKIPFQSISAQVKVNYLTPGKSVIIDIPAESVTIIDTSPDPLIYLHYPH